ncbi:hypothetical protein L202_00173 [Cryptococcus amylolentus CBS 6039]|uniref:Uncharacterized protein n=2 Tax=Cryptococcus amylolentus TaxID=104669 RepID=A0A1E3I8P8_9TREE|nr:hypothetical protein L202_00173 [Cryptococcus amylolentus CBS 6039]ODN84171.1 hypothetical protein L202_00173 [Cryptococcus amylolentus CBS 6039]ODO11970.1 hypothetical protein I350_00754 [Cryptococcus amylolentus CBS 6273]
MPARGTTSTYHPHTVTIHEYYETAHVSSARHVSPSAVASSSTSRAIHSSAHAATSTHNDEAAYTGAASSATDYGSTTSASIDGSIANSTVTSVTTTSTSSTRRPPLTIGAAVAIAVVSSLVVVGSIILIVMYVRRRRRMNKMPGNVAVPKRKKEKGGGRPLERIETPVPKAVAQLRSERSLLPQPSPPRMSQRETTGVVLPTHPRPAAAYPNPSYQSPFLDPPRSSLTPATSRHRPESTYTDDSEFDMLAQDGSSYARTLSTYSEGVNSEYSERDLGTFVPMTSTSAHGHFSDTITMSARPTLAVDTKSASGPSDEGTWTYTAVDSSSAGGSGPGSGSGSSGWNPLLTATTPYSSTTRTLVSPFADPPSLPQPNTGSGSFMGPYLSHPSPSVVSDRSWRTEDDALLIARGAALDRERSVREGGLRRGTTIVRHLDGGSVPGREEEARDDEEVHLPPAYGELYPH